MGAYIATGCYFLVFSYTNFCVFRLHKHYLYAKESTLLQKEVSEEFTAFFGQSSPQNISQYVNMAFPDVKSAQMRQSGNWLNEIVSIKVWVEDPLTLA